MSKKKTSEDYNPEIVPYGNEKKLPSLAPESTGKKSAVVAHLIQTMDIAGHTNVDDIDSLKNALQEYLMLCHQTNTSVTNTGMYAALGITGDTVRNWITGKSRSSDPRYREFGKLVKSICAQYRELAAAENALNPTLLIWWQKQYDGFVEEPGPDKVDESAFVTAVDPDEIAEKYKRLLDDESGKRLEAEREKRTIAIPEEEEETDE